MLCATVKEIKSETPKLFQQLKIRFRCWYHLSVVLQPQKFGTLTSTETPLGQVPRLAIEGLYSNLDMTLT